MAGSGAPVGPAARARGASLFGTDVIGLPTGASITPDAAPGSRLFELDPHLAGAPELRAGGAVASALAPDGRTLLVLTSGYNRTYDAAGTIRLDASTEYVFVYDLSGADAREAQVVPVANAFGGIAFHPAGDRFFVGGGSDDVVHTFARGADGDGPRTARQSRSGTSTRWAAAASAGINRRTPPGSRPARRARGSWSRTTRTTRSGSSTPRRAR